MRLSLALLSLTAGSFEGPVSRLWSKKAATDNTGMLVSGLIPMMYILINV